MAIVNVNVIRLYVVCVLVSILNFKPAFTATTSRTAVAAFTVTASTAAKLSIMTTLSGCSRTWGGVGKPIKEIHVENLHLRYSQSRRYEKFDFSASPCQQLNSKSLAASTLQKSQAAEHHHKLSDYIARCNHSLCQRCVDWNFIGHSEACVYRTTSSAENGVPRKLSSRRKRVNKRFVGHNNT